MEKKFGRFNKSHSQRRVRYQRLKTLIQESPYLETYNVYKKNQSSFHAEADFAFFRERANPSTGKFYKSSSLGEALIKIAELKSNPYLHPNQFHEDEEAGFTFGRDIASKVTANGDRIALNVSNKSRIIDEVFAYIEKYPIDPVRHSVSDNLYYQGLLSGIEDLINNPPVKIMSGIKKADLGPMGLNIGDLGDSQETQPTGGGEDQNRKRRALNPDDEDELWETHRNKNLELDVLKNDEDLAKIRKENILVDQMDKLPAPTNPDWGSRGLKL